MQTADVKTLLVHLFCDEPLLPMVKAPRLVNNLNIHYEYFLPRIPCESYKSIYLIGEKYRKWRQ